MNRMTITTITLAAALTLAGCGADTDTDTAPATSESTTSSSSTSSSPSTTTTTVTSTRPAETTSAEPQAAAPAETMLPGDPRLMQMAAFSDTVGVFLDSTNSNPEGRYYWVCNGGDAGAEYGSPVEPGTCAGPLTYAESQVLGEQLYYAVLNGIAGSLEELGQELQAEYGYDDGLASEGDITARFWECIDAGGTEESCLEM